MAGTADSDAYVQSNTFLDPGEDLELECTSSFFPHVPDNTTTARPRNPLVDHVPELSFFGEAFDSQSIVPQYSYLPPIAASDRQPLPYPRPSVRTSEAVAYYTPSDDCTETAWAPRYSHTDSLTVDPNQVGLVNVGHRDGSYARARGVSKAVVDQSTLSVTTHTLQSVASNQSSALIQPFFGSRTATLVNDPCRDASTPYIPGTIVRRNTDLQHLTNVLTAVVERPSFACSSCNKNLKTRSALNHHKITHNKDKAHRHKCPKCDAGFRYPKDLRRHDDTRHGDARYSCADCHKTYGRKDHLTRHTLRSGHTALSERPLLPSASLPTTERQDVSSPVSTKLHQNGYPQLFYHPYDHDLSQNLHDIGSSPPTNAAATYSYPALLEVPRSIPSFGSTSSLDGTGSFTASEVDSFSSETFYLG